MCMLCAEGVAASVAVLSGWRLWLHYGKQLLKSLRRAQ